MDGYDRGVKKIHIRGARSEIFLRQIFECCGILRRIASRPLGGRAGRAPHGGAGVVKRSPPPIYAIRGLNFLSHLISFGFYRPVPLRNVCEQKKLPHSLPE